MKKLLGLLLVLALSLPVLANSAVSTGAVPPQADQGNPDIRVLVNTASGVYHCPGTRWYGKTKQRAYMKQAEAQKKGNRPAYGKVCR